MKATLTHNIAEGDYHTERVWQGAETKLAATLRQILLKSVRVSTVSVMLTALSFKIKGLRRSKHSEIP